MTDEARESVTELLQRGFHLADIRFNEDGTAHVKEDLVPRAGEDLITLQEKAAALASIILKRGSVAEAVGLLVDAQHETMLTAEDIARRSLPETAIRQYEAWRHGFPLPPLDWAAISQTHATESPRMTTYRSTQSGVLLEAKIGALQALYADCLPSGTSVSAAHVMVFEQQYSMLHPLLEAVVTIRALQEGTRDAQGRLNERILTEQRECEQVYHAFEKSLETIWKQANRVRAEIEGNMELLRARSQALKETSNSGLQDMQQDGDVASRRAQNATLPYLLSASSLMTKQADLGGMQHEAIEHGENELENREPHVRQSNGHRTEEVQAIEGASLSQDNGASTTEDPKRSAKKLVQMTPEALDRGIAEQKDSHEDGHGDAQDTDGGQDSSNAARDRRSPVSASAAGSSPRGGNKLPNKVATKLVKFSSPPASIIEDRLEEPVSKGTKRGRGDRGDTDQQCLTDDEIDEEEVDDMQNGNDSQHSYTLTREDQEDQPDDGARQEKRAKIQDSDDEREEVEEEEAGRKIAGSRDREDRNMLSSSDPIVDSGIDTSEHVAEEAKANREELPGGKKAQSKADDVGVLTQSFSEDKKPVAAVSFSAHWFNKSGPARFGFN